MASSTLSDHQRATLLNLVDMTLGGESVIGGPKRSLYVLVRKGLAHRCEWHTARRTLAGQAEVARLLRVHGDAYTAVHPDGVCRHQGTRHAADGSVDCPLLRGAGRG